jgi:hypothetical protein
MRVGGSAGSLRHPLVGVTLRAAFQSIRMLLHGEDCQWYYSPVSYAKQERE